MRFEWLQRWWWRLRLQRIERMNARLKIGLQPGSVWDFRLIERLTPQELRDVREVQAERRWRKDALYTLELERFRLNELLKPELPKQTMHEAILNGVKENFEVEE